MPHAQESFMQQDIKTPLEWSQETRGANAFHIGTRDGRTVAIIRESRRGVCLQCAGYDKASLYSGRYKNAADIEAAFAVCEIHAQKLKPIRDTKRRDTLIGRALQTDRETPLEDEDDAYWAC
jgi:hypothetical protein